MGLDSKLPPDWRVAAAVAVGVVAIIGWTESRMTSVAEAAVISVQSELRQHEALGDEYLRQLREDAAKTRSIAEKLLADCHARGGCR